MIQMLLVNTPSAAMNKGALPSLPPQAAISWHSGFSPLVAGLSGLLQVFAQAYDGELLFPVFVLSRRESLPLYFRCRGPHIALIIRLSSTDSSGPWCNCRSGAACDMSSAALDGT
ncbi:hypothetical protein BD311DRAFT_761635 [Dichomitus squalens]|uniref:Uncharacterized protein n=1 Tax=Dichomitus squalens TaxID=114155 RepID=A0A4Q9MH74_9APHY|nr:hypothetical protein BD311DRAFT_761635 [Dichomitus squalens]